MHNEPQIQDNGNKGNAVTEGHPGEEVKHCCCGKNFKLLVCANKHASKCKFLLGVLSGQLIEGMHFVKCNICGMLCKSLTKHLTQTHMIEKSEYQGQLMATCSLENYHVMGKHNGAWIRRAREAGIDLSEHFASTGPAKSRGILASQFALDVRKANMTNLNKRPERRQRSSEVAKITSARSDIIEKRTQNLKKWIATHPNEHYEKCIKAMHSSWQSAPEAALFEIVRQHKDFQFKRGQIMKSKNFSQISKRKQLDIADVKRHVYIEFDGIHHFVPIRGDELLALTRCRDNELDKQIRRKGWTLIRVAASQWYKKKFNDNTLMRLQEILDTPMPGVFYFGNEYNHLNILDEG